MASRPPDFDDLLARLTGQLEGAVRVEVSGRSVSFATAEDLLLHKLFAGRPRDLEAAIRALRASAETSAGHAPQRASNRAMRFRLRPCSARMPRRYVPKSNGPPARRISASMSPTMSTASR